MLHSNNVIGCENQIKIGAAFGKARDPRMTPKLEFVSGQGFEWRVRFEFIHVITECVF